MRSVRRLFSLVVVTLASSLALSATAWAANGNEADFARRINAERHGAGVAALVVRSDLSAVARAHSAEMARQGTIYHNSSLTRQVEGWRKIGENVGMGPDVDTLHSMFMASSGHRANILHRTYNQIGIGVVIADDGTMYVTQVFALRGGVTKTVRHTAPRPTRSHAPARAAVATPRAPSAPAAQRHTAVASPPAQTVEMLVQLMDLDADATQ